MSQKPAMSRSERHRGERALGDFVEYVERQQALRFSHRTASTATCTTGDTEVTAPETNTADDGMLDDLDAVINGLDLGDAAPQVPMRQLLLGDEDGAAGAADGQPSALSVLLARRIDDGQGEFVLDVGFEHNGDGLGLTRAQWDAALAAVERAAEGVGAACQLLLTHNVGGPLEGDSGSGGGGGGGGQRRDGCTGRVMVRRRPRRAEEVTETRVAVVGNVDAGKSTLLGVLAKGELDDGRGRARVSLFRHKHEAETGRTSSVGMEMLGFDARGSVVASAATPGRRLSWEEIGRRSAKVVAFADLAGHEGYLHTTVYGMTSTAPDYCLLMVAANHGLAGMSREHLGIALALHVPVLVVVTKIDLCPPAILAQTMAEITCVLRSPGARRVPVLIASRDDCVRTATQLVSQHVCPVFQVSNVTGERLDLVRLFLSMLPPRRRPGDVAAALELHVNEVYSVPFVGTVVSGIVRAGVVRVGDAVWIGPDALGGFASTTVRSIERRRVGVPAAFAGQAASIALRKIRRRDVRKGQVVLRKTDSTLPTVYREFVAEVLILSHQTTIKPRYQAMLHVGSVAQTCAVIDMDRPLLRTGARASVAFRFLQRPEFLAPGDRLLFREGRTKGLGIVTSVGYDPAHPLLPSRPEDGGE